MSEFIFAYGSNMCTGRVRVYGVNPEGQGLPARLPDYRLCFNKKSTKDGSGKANVEAEDSESVWGVLYSIADVGLALLDKGEKGYIRKKLRVIAEGKIVEAWVYIAAVPDNDPTLKPYSWYKRFLIEGAREHRIEAGYIAKLEQISAAPDKNEKRDQEMRAIPCAVQPATGGLVV